MDHILVNSVLAATTCCNLVQRVCFTLHESCTTVPRRADVPPRRLRTARPAVSLAPPALSSFRPPPHTAHLSTTPVSGMARTSGPSTATARPDHHPATIDSTCPSPGRSNLPPLPGRRRRPAEKCGPAAPRKPSPPNPSRQDGGRPYGHSSLRASMVGGECIRYTPGRQPPIFPRSSLQRRGSHTLRHGHRDAR